MVFILALVGVYYYLANSATIPTAFAANVLDQSTTVYYSDGHTVLGTIGTVDRQDLTINQIPKGLQDAVISAEDRGFWTEGGISPTGILRAAYEDVTGASGASPQGGSTITQEFVRNYYANVGTQQTISRKIKEIFIAQKLASSKSKDWILQNYMNVIYLGDGSYGVAAAAETYFGKPVSKLTVAQDAVIAAIIQAPSTYYLPQYRTNLEARWHYVLSGMVKIGDLSQAQADSMKFPKLLTDNPSYTPPGLTSGCSTTSTEPWAAYLMTQVCDELEAPATDGGEHLNPTELDNGGMKVVTTVSLPMEEEIYKAVNENTAQMSQVEGEYGKTDIGLPSWLQIGAEVQNPSNGEILAEYPGRGESASVCAHYVDCQDNTVWNDREQVGSSFKPYDLSAAVQQGMNVQTSILNSSTYACIAPNGFPPYSEAISESVYYDNPFGPSNQSYGCTNNDAAKLENDSGEIIGNPVGPKGDNIYGSHVQNALALSSNTAFTDLAHRVTTPAVIQMAQAYGVNIADTGLTGPDSTAVPFVAIGESSLTVNEQAQMIATIDDNGTFHAAHIVKSWQLPDQAVQTPVVATRQVLTPAQDSQVQYAMAGTTVYGTATDASVGLGNRPIIGKTGTTTGFLSAFFLGAIPQYAMAIGMFTPSPTYKVNGVLASIDQLGGGGVGGYWPAKIWNTFAQAEFANLSVDSFQNPVFTGSTWNMIGPLPKAKPKKKKCNPQQGGGNGNGNGNGNGGGRGHGHGNVLQIPELAVGCVTTSPTPTPTPTPTNTASGNPTSTPTGLPTITATPTPTTSGTATPTSTASVTPTPTASASHTGFPFGAADSAATTASGVKAGLAVGGVLAALLPGSLLWTTASRRRRKRGARANR